MNDIANRTIQINDEVVLNSKPGSSYGTNQLHIGIVIGFTKLKVKVRSKVRASETILKDPKQLYIIKDT